MISIERQEVLKKIKDYESKGLFNEDVENDPPSTTLMPDQADYLRKKWRNKIARFFVSRAADKAIANLIKQNQIIIKDVIGKENLQGIEGTAFITSNHFHVFENMALYQVFKDFAPKKDFYRVIREGNYTAPPEAFKLFLRHCNTLPLSSHPATMKKFVQAIDVLSKQNKYILIYPEQSMWWNYKKPRPFKDGAFRFACKNDRPIIPCFITMEDSKEHIDGDGAPVQEYTIHIMKPIYRDKNLPFKEAALKMKEQNFNMCKEIYERVYNKALTYAEDEE